MKKIKGLLLVSAAAVLSACSATPEQCDPNVELSLWGKMACANSGSYDNRVKQKENELAAEQERNVDSQIENAEAQTAKDKSAKQVSAKKAELNKLNKSLNSYATQLKAKAKNNKQVLGQINAVEKKMKQVNASGAADSAKQAELEKLKRQLDTYQKALGL